MSNRDEYLKRLRGELGVIDREIDELESELRSASAPQPEKELRAAMDDVKKHYERVARELEKADRAGTEAWHDIRDGLDSAWDDLKAAFRKARNRLGD